MRLRALSPQVGDEVTTLKVGDRVVGGLGTIGGLCRACGCSCCFGPRVLPDNVGFGESTGLNYAYGTTLYGLKYRGESAGG